MIVAFPGNIDLYMIQRMTKPIKWHVCPAKTQADQRLCCALRTQAFFMRMIKPTTNEQRAATEKPPWDDQ